MGTREKVSVGRVGRPGHERRGTTSWEGPPGLGRSCSTGFTSSQVAGAGPWLLSTWPMQSAGGLSSGEGNGVPGADEIRFPRVGDEWGSEQTSPVRLEAREGAAVTGQPTCRAQAGRGTGVKSGTRETWKL